MINDFIASYDISSPTILASPSLIMHWVYTRVASSTKPCYIGKFATAHHTPFGTTLIYCEFFIINAHFSLPMEPSTLNWRCLQEENAFNMFFFWIILKLPTCCIKSKSNLWLHTGWNLSCGWPRLALKHSVLMWRHRISVQKLC